MNPYWCDGQATLYLGDAREVLASMEADSVHCVVTSPPYWGLRNYGLPPSIWGGEPGCAHEWGGSVQPATKLGVGSNTNGTYADGVIDKGKAHATTGVPKGSAFCLRCGAWLGALGLEPSLELYVAHLVEIFREVRRVLHPTGTVGLNLGDSYASGKGTCYNPGGGENSLGQKRKAASVYPLDRGNKSVLRVSGLKPKDLVGIPWRVAFALQADGWWLRSDIIWAKPNPMPESVTDRPTRSHEYVFLLAKAERYYYDQEAVREPSTERSSGNKKRQLGVGGINDHLGSSVPYQPDRTGHNRRSVWTIPTQPFSGAHFATFPEALVELCILAGSSEAGCCPKCRAPWKRIMEKVAMKIRRTSWGELAGNRTASSGTMLKPPQARTLGWWPSCTCEAGPPLPCIVLDPFVGSGTVCAVAKRLGRHAVGIDLKAEYLDMAVTRCQQMALPLARPPASM